MSGCSTLDVHVKRPAHAAQFCRVIAPAQVVKLCKVQFIGGSRFPPDVRNKVYGRLLNDGRICALWASAATNFSAPGILGQIMSADEIQILHALPDLSQALSHSDASMFTRFAVHSDYHGDRAVTTTPSRPDDASPSCPHIFQELREIPMTNDLINDIWMDTDMKCVVVGLGIFEPSSIFTGRGL